MRPDHAARDLGLTLDENLTEGAIVKAAANAIAKAHPDNGGDADLAPNQIKHAQECRKALLTHIQSDVPPGHRVCPTCNGKGEVRANGWLRTECPKCGGAKYLPL